MASNKYFTSPERISEAGVEEQEKLFAGSTRMEALFDSVNEMVAVLNSSRQVIFANQPFIDFLELPSLADLRGKRLGECLECINVRSGIAGCGTSEECSQCAGVKLIAEALKTKESVTEDCLITGRREGQEVPYNLRLKTTPFTIQKEDFILLSLKDISEEKHKKALERIFFHDILNTVSSIKVYLELMKRMGDRDGAITRNIETITDSLVEEIHSQKMLINAENRSLRKERNLIVTDSFLEELIHSFEPEAVNGEKRVEIAPFSGVFSVVTDSAILRRVLVNGIKNALEASPEGSRITVGVHAQEEARVLFKIHNPGYIKEEIQRQLFRRFFSTKGESRGLGTYSMKLLTEVYLEGLVWFESSEEKGTTFYILIPGKG